MTTSAELYSAALAPYVTRTNNRVPNLSGAIQKMIDYNSRMGLGLSDAQIVAGIKAFGDRHNQNFGNASVSQQSNYNAVAAESIERALTLAGKDGGAFWNSAVKDAYPVTSDGAIPGMPAEGGSWATKVIRGMPDQNWDYNRGGYFSTPDDPLEKAVNNWISNQPASQYLYAHTPVNTVEGYTNQTPMTFSDQQRKYVADAMRTFNSVLNLGLTDAEMATGINKFSGAQYQIYQQGYNVGSDPYNIARWSLWNALNDKGATAVGDKLIESTNAKQALTAQQAEELYNKADEWVNSTYTEIERQRKKANDIGFFGHLKNLAAGAAPIIALFSGIGTLLGPVAGAAAVSGSGIAASFADLIGAGEVYANFTSAIGTLGTSAAELIGATGNLATGISSGVSAAASSVIPSVLSGGSFSDVLTNAVTSGLTSGGAAIVGNAVAGEISGIPTGATDDQYTSVDTAGATDRFPLTGTVAGAVAGATGGIISAGLTGGDIGSAALTGGAAGAAAGGVGVDLGAGQDVGGAVGTVTAGLVNQVLQDDTGTTPTDTVTTPTDTGTGVSPAPNNYALDWGYEGAPSFATLLPAITGRPEWGTRLSRRTV